MGTKTPQTISHNHIKIKGIKIIGQKHENTKSTQFYQPIRIRASIGPSNTTHLIHFHNIHVLKDQHTISPSQSISINTQALCNIYTKTQS